MAFTMELEDWPLFSGQLTPFNAPTFDVLAERSDDCDYHLFSDDVFCKGRGTDLAWSPDYASEFESRCMTPPLASSPEQYGLLVLPKDAFSGKQPPSIQPASPITELPSSPENYFNTFDSRYSPAMETPTTAFLPGFVNPLEISTAVLTKVAASYSVVPNLPVQLSDLLDVAIHDHQSTVVVPDIQELSDGDEEEMLLELDDADSDIIIDHEKLASIGPFLPSVSLDDVLSLLSPSSSPCSEVTSPMLSCPTVITFSLPVPSTTDIQMSSPMAHAATALSPVACPVEQMLATPAGSPTGPSSIPVGYDPASSPISNHGSSNIGSPASSVCSSLVGAGHRPHGERRQRKKEQNKTAAQRYREKKRSEHGTVLSEYQVLEQRNQELHAKVMDMTKEIAYLKGLIDEICS